MLKQVKMNSKISENPFYGKSNLKTLLNQGKSISNKSTMFSMLDSAWKECKDTKELREGFFCVLFSICEITNRQHNIFGKKKVDNGGNAARPQGMWIMSWLRKNNSTQYYKFMFARIINEFISFFVILAAQVRTSKGKKNIDTTNTDTYNALLEQDLNKVAEFCASIILKGSIIDKIMLAKWLVNVRTSKRQLVDKKTKEKKSGGRELQEFTKKCMYTKQELYTKLSEILNWEVIQHKHNIQFKGLNNWKKQYNQSFESVLFSTGKIKELDKEQFFNLLNTCPSGARYRIQRRLVDGDSKSKDKWFSNYGNIDFAIWFKEWESFKETKQAEERVLTEKIRQGVATEKDKEDLKKTQKEAKVNVGASSLFDELTKLLQGKGNDLLIHSIMNKVKFEVPVLFAVDRSGSMGGTSENIAKLLTTIGMLKNPSDELDNILITFGTDATIYTDRSKVESSKNRFMKADRTTIIDKIIDRTKSFQQNFNIINSIINANDGSTNVESIGRRLGEWIDSESELRQHRIEQLQSYPVILIISDNAFNNGQCSASSLGMLQNRLSHYGWNGVIVIWDTQVNDNVRHNEPFAGLNNVFHYYGWNLGAINQIFANIHDLDVIDVYTELKSLWLSNRYEPIRQNTL